MAKLIWISVLALTMIGCGQNKTQVDKSKEKIDNVCDSVMKTFTKGNFSGAFDILQENTVMSPSSIDTLKVRTAEYAKITFPAYGKIRSFEFILERKIKNVITKRFYILKFDDYYLKFDFTLYNNGDKWTITSFAYDEDLIELLY